MSHTDGEPISVESLCKKIDTINATAMALIEKLQRERTRYREALEVLLPGLILDLRYADDDDDKDAMRARIKTVQEALADGEQMRKQK